MSLPSTVVDREPIHTRRVTVNSYRREDGLWEFEAFLHDSKHYQYETRFRGTVPAGVPVHDMAIRLAVDDGLTIREATASMAAHPYPDCTRAPVAYERLIGLTIGAGWISKVKRRIDTVEGCTHLFELLRPLATTVYQTILPLRRDHLNTTGRRPMLIDSCQGWRGDGEAVRVMLPDWHRARSGD